MKHWAGRVASALALSVLSLTTGCGTFFIYTGNLNGGGTGSTANDYVYIANQTTGQLAGYAVGTGKLTAVSGSPYSLGFAPTSMAVNPADSILFVAGVSGGIGYINSSSIGSSGVLTLLVSNNVGAASEVSMDVSPDGNWLLGLDSSSTTLSAAVVDEYSINSSTGKLTLGTGASYGISGAGANNGPGTVNPTAIKFSPGGGLVFVGLGTAGDLVFTFTSSPSGVLSASQTAYLAFGSGFSDDALAVSSNGSYLYIARSGTSGQLVADTITGSAGVLTTIGSPVAAGTQPFAVVANSTNVYVANRGNSSSTAISGYSVNSSTGAPAALNSYSSGSSVTALALDKSGKYLLAAANGSTTDLWMYSFDTSGNLVYATSVDATGAGAVALAATH